MLAKKWKFHDMAGSKSSLLIESPITRMLGNITCADLCGYHEMASRLISVVNVVLTTLLVLNFAGL